MDDPEWPGQLHIPGTVQRTWAGETSDAALRLLIAQELGTSVGVQILAELGRYEHIVPPRGMEIALVYIANVRGQTQHGDGEWHPFQRMPEDLLEYQRRSFIPDAIARIRELQSEGRL